MILNLWLINLDSFDIPWIILNIKHHAYANKFIKQINRHPAFYLHIVDISHRYRINLTNNSLVITGNMLLQIKEERALKKIELSDTFHL